ncbi:MAG: hypothetical protein JWM47_4541 [Acidimicrobiales bacterium]|nr:hypothetical protein [Acidimicrobiales bacterium]
MTELAHDAALLGIPVDPLRLYHADEDAQQFLDVVVTEVFNTRERIRNGG